MSLSLSPFGAAEARYVGIVIILPPIFPSPSLSFLRCPLAPAEAKVKAEAKAAAAKFAKRRHCGGDVSQTFCRKRDGEGEERTRYSFFSHSLSPSLTRMLSKPKRRQCSESYLREELYSYFIGRHFPLINDKTETQPTNCLNERFGCFYLPPIGNRLVSLGCLEQVSLEKNRKYEVEGRAMRKEALTPTPPKEKLSSHATRGFVTRPLEICGRPRRARRGRGRGRPSDRFCGR